MINQCSLSTLCDTICDITKSKVNLSEVDYESYHADEEEDVKSARRKKNLEKSKTVMQSQDWL